MQKCQESSSSADTSESGEQSWGLCVFMSANETSEALATQAAPHGSKFELKNKLGMSQGNS